MILHAIDVTIDQVQERGGPDRDEQLAMLFDMRRRWREKAESEGLAP